MDTEAIANEIVALKNRLRDDPHLSDEERADVQQRIGKLQGDLAESDHEATDEPHRAPDTVRYIPPA